VGPEQPVLPDDPTANDESIWEYLMNDSIKIERILKKIYKAYTQ